MCYFDFMKACSGFISTNLIGHLKYICDNYGTSVWHFSFLFISKSNGASNYQSSQCIMQQPQAFVFLKQCQICWDENPFQFFASHLMNLYIFREIKQQKHFCYAVLLLQAAKC